MNFGKGLPRAVRSQLADLVEWLFGCSHRRTTFPITLPTGARKAGADSGETETYVVCLECGRHIAYDWTTMRLTWYAPSQRPAGTPGNAPSHLDPSLSASPLCGIRRQVAIDRSGR